MKYQRNATERNIKTGKLNNCKCLVAWKSGDKILLSPRCLSGVVEAYIVSFAVKYTVFHRYAFGWVSTVVFRALWGFCPVEIFEHEILDDIKLYQQTLQRATSVMDKMITGFLCLHDLIVPRYRQKLFAYVLATQRILSSPCNGKNGIVRLCSKVWASVYVLWS